MTDIVISEFIEPSALGELAREFAVTFDPELWNRREALATTLAEARALIVRNKTPVDAALLERAPRLEVVGRLGVGLDNIDVGHCERTGVAVLSARGANATSVAEYVLAMAMTLLRGPAYLGTAALLGGAWPREAVGRGRELSGATLGIVGLGSIGAVTAEKARALGMKVVACDDALPDGHPSWQIAPRRTLDALLAEACVVTLHCPLTAATRGLVSAARIAQMKPGAILINSARGGIVDHRALADALRRGHLGGAALDVFEPEPLGPDDRAALADAPNLILTPHISGVTLQSNHRVSHMTATAVARLLRGQP